MGEMSSRTRMMGWKRNRLRTAPPVARSRPRPPPYLLLPKHVPLGDAVEQGVGDLARGAGHHNADGFSLQTRTNTRFTFPRQRAETPSRTPPTFDL